MNMKKLIILLATLALVLVACGGGSGGGGGTDTTAPPSSGAGDAVAGADVYKATCAACHSGDLAGIDGLGLPLVPSNFVTSQSEADLAEFITVGRTADDPANVTGTPMFPKGGNPALSDQDILDVAAYLQAQN